MTLSPVKMKPRYIEKELYIRKDLRVTLIYKSSCHLSRCLLRGYGGYNTFEHAHECSYYYPLIERGFVIAIAHLRGGGEYGFKGYSDGRLRHKKNTFSDFIETAHFLFEKKITSRDKLAIWGRSFGGLLISSVLNQEPDICKVALLGVPFVTPMKALKTYKTPLGIETRSELGDPVKMEKYLKSYDPLENIKDGPYPNMLIYTNVNDTLVPYKEPYEYYKKMKELPVYTSGKSTISFFMDYRFGHTQGSLVKDKSEHFGLLFTFLLKYI
jgi:protease II